MIGRGRLGSGWAIAVMTTIGCGPRPATNDEQPSETSSANETGSSSESTSSEASETETGSAFVPVFDTMGPNQCDPWLQDCPVGDKCVPYDSYGGGYYTNNRCVPLMGDRIGPRRPRMRRAGRDRVRAVLRAGHGAAEQRGRRHLRAALTVAILAYSMAADLS